MGCPRCGAENRPGSKFCKSCGASLARACLTCGSALDAGARFCDECGSPVDVAPSVVGAPADSVARDAPTAERRLVSILFADLVGFTTLSEKRDAEEVRELLTRYFDGCREVIARYGGIVEKFIGDAVMAVWGTPVAHEDDAERSVRAALELVDMVASMGAELEGAPLRARAGVLTGEAAVSIGSATQGMVAGDMVNTASRIQAVAEPGTVLVGEATHRATEAAVEYEDAGGHVLKGKAEPLRLWRAVRVIATRRGALRSTGLEAPFSGRDRQLRLVKDLFHATADERSAHLISVVGVAGIGKSRLAWEFCKYIDGLATDVFWHAGRCLAYGDGVTYSALAEIVRMRTGISEGEALAPAREKLRACLAENVPDVEEQRWIEPRLAHLLGLEERVAADREDLFGAWRLFFERLAEQSPTVLVIEDLQWADSSLLEFVEHLLDWSRNHALYIITLARPELAERYPTWGAGRRSFTSLFLDPLRDEAMHQLLAGLVPGMPDELRGRIVDRAAGVPLYAVETVRSLVDRGLLVADGSGFRLTGEVDTLDVPETLHALIAARLDGLPAPARRLLQDASVLGKTFSSAAAAAVGGMAPIEATALLDDLVRREVLALQADPRSPERGQYSFVQDLIRWVCYETMSRHDRKHRHLAAAAWMEEAWGETDRDVVEVVASHFLEAYRLGPEDADAAAIRTRAAEVLVKAAEHAASLAANAEAQHYFEQALELVDGADRRAALHERAGEMALLGDRIDQASDHFESAIRLFDEAGLPHPAARASAGSAEIARLRGDLDTAITRMEAAFTVLSSDPPDADLARLASQLGRFHFFAGNLELAMGRTRVALDIAEHLPLYDIVSHSLNTLGIIASVKGNRQEGTALISHGLVVALDHDIPSAALRSYCNVADYLTRIDRDREGIVHLRSALALARRAGDRPNERYVLSELIGALDRTGQWREATEHIQALSADAGYGDLLSLFEAWIDINIRRGTVDEAERVLNEYGSLGVSSDVQTRTAYASSAVSVDSARGRHDKAFDAILELLANSSIVLDDQSLKKGLVDGLESGLAVGRVSEVEAALDSIEARSAAERPPFVTAHAARFRARLAAARGDAAVSEAGFAQAIDILDESDSPFWLAVTRLEYAEWLSENGRRREAEPLLEAARATFVDLEATPWADRCAGVTVLSSVS